MAANTTQIHFHAGDIEHAQISTANTNRDGTGTLVTVFTADTDGSLVYNVRAVAEGTTTAGVVRLFLDDGANTYLWKEMIVSAVTPSTIIAVWEQTFTPGSVNQPFILPSGWTIKAAPHNAETFNIFTSAVSY